MGAARPFPGLLVGHSPTWLSHVGLGAGDQCRGEGSSGPPSTAFPPQVSSRCWNGHRAFAAQRPCNRARPHPRPSPSGEWAGVRDLHYQTTNYTVPWQ